MQRIFSPNREKRRNTVLLRGLLVVAVGGLLVDAGSARTGTAALAVVVAFAVSDLCLAFVPLRRVATHTFELVVGAADIGLVALGIHLAGTGRGALPISCLLMVLVVALGSQRASTVAGAAAVGAAHSWLFLRVASGADAGRELALQILFLCPVGLYYGFLTDGIHRHRRRKEAEQLEHREMSTLLEVLEAISSSLDLRDVALNIVTRVAQIVPAVRCSLLYVGGPGTPCHVLASHDNPDIEKFEIDLAKYPEVRRALETRAPVIIGDVSADPLMADVRDRIKALDFQSIMVIPLTFGEDLLGSLFLRSARAKRSFSEREIQFCTAVARASASAFKRALLHREVADALNEQRSTGEKLARILNHSPDLILTTDNAGRIAEFNQEAERTSGYAREEMIERPVTDLLADAGNGDLLRRLRTGGAVSDHACRLRKKDGSEIEMEVRVAVLKNDGGEAAGSVWIGRDVTDTRATQQQLMQAEKLSTMGQVVAGVAHELNNPLTGVLGYSQLLMARHHDPALSAPLEKIRESAQRCQRIVKSLLAFARVHKPERKLLDVNRIVEKTLDMRGYQLRVNDIEVVRDLDPELPSTLLDFHQIQQVLLNLIANAEHAILSARPRPGRVMIRTRDADGIIRIEVADNGAGMPPSTLARVFDPFFTTKPEGEGTGLGLSVSYGIVKEHGGRICAESREGEGSTFMIELPVLGPEAEGSLEVADRPPAVASRTAASGSVLVVDDEPTIVELLNEILEELGHRVDTAANGEEACDKVSAGHYDLVITDVRMPRMDGMEFYRRALSMRPELRNRVIFITGDLMDAKIGQFLADHQARIIPKPLEISEVAEIVQEILAST